MVQYFKKAKKGRNSGKENNLLGEISSKIKEGDDPHTTG